MGIRSTGHPAGILPAIGQGAAGQVSISTGELPMLAVGDITITALGIITDKNNTKGKNFAHSAGI